MIETEEFVTFANLDHALKRVMLARSDFEQRKKSNGSLEPGGWYRRVLEAGIRAARNRDPKLLMVLDKGSEILQKASVDQWGTTTYADSTRIEADEYQQWRNAYVQADEGGTEMLIYQHIYSAAAIIAGFVY